MSDERWTKIWEAFTGDPMDPKNNTEAGLRRVVELLDGTPEPQIHMRGDGEAAIIECLAAGQSFVFDPATNFLHADDGTVEGGIRYLPAPDGFALIPLVPTEETIEAICQEHTRCHWPDDFDRTAQAIRRQDARDGYEIAIKLAATTEGQR